MGFKFVTNDNAKNSPILWKFENHPTQYQSDQIRFERNVEFWRNKMGFASTERVVTLNGEFEPIEYTDFEEVKDIEVKEPEYIEFTELKEETHDEPVTTPHEPTNVSSDIVSDSKSDVQPSVSQDTKAPVNTTKRKPRKKTT